MLVTCVAPVNIAVIKYWGKRNEELVLPLNDSISATLDTDQTLHHEGSACDATCYLWGNCCKMHAKTTIMASPNFKEDRMWLNGREVPVDTPRIQNCLKEIVMRAEQTGRWVLQGCHLHICSENNFPTGAGLASSAAGYACLVFTLAKLVGLEGDISGIARLGSGSACRSVLGGFVRWHKGSSPSGCDSVATQVVPAAYWPQLRIVILVVNDEQKSTSSTSGMQRSVQTSDLLAHRTSQCVPSRVEDITQAIQERDFRKFGELTMKDSNQFHAVCLDTFPPLFYMSDLSRAIVDFVHKYNATDLQVAYTFDAGPNACLFVLEDKLPHLLATIIRVFPPAKGCIDYMRGIPVTVPHIGKEDLVIEPKEAGLLKYVLVTRLGAGPQEVADHLLTAAGQPKRLASPSP